jgi:hypothetical protein
MEWREITKEYDTNEMLNFVDIGHHFISLYLDHGESLKVKNNWDDVVHY